MRKKMPVAQRVLGENHDKPLEMRSMYAEALFNNPSATLDDLREAVTTLEETERIARRVLGGAHPTTTAGESNASLPAKRARSSRPASQEGLRFRQRPVVAIVKLLMDYAGSDRICRQSIAPSSLS